MNDVRHDAEVVMRRFKDRRLTGKDLQTIRSSVVDITQEELSKEWGISRTLVSRIEGSEEPDQRLCDQYLGLMMRRFFFLQAG